MMMTSESINLFTFSIEQNLNNNPHTIWCSMKKEITILYYQVKDK